MELSFDTPTVAELFYRQSQPKRAVTIYRRVLLHNPGNSEAASRLHQIEAELERGSKAMDFRQLMHRLVKETPGALACTLMGFDGIPIDTFDCGEAKLDVQALLTEISSLANFARGLRDNHATGNLGRLSLETEGVSAVVRPLTEEYFMAMVLAPDGLPGRAEFEMRMVAPRLIAELS